MKITDFLRKWGRVIYLAVIALGLLFALGCCIYTAATGSQAVGLIGCIFVALNLAVVIARLVEEAKEVDDAGA